MTEYQKEIDLDSSFELPEDSVYFKRDNFNIVLRPTYAKWIVLNELEFSVYQALKEKRTLIATVETLTETTSWNSQTVFEALASFLSQVYYKDFSTDFHTDISHSKGFCIMPTMACNLKCAHCYLSNQTNKGAEEKSIFWIDLLKNGANHGFSLLTISGGEPTQYSSLEPLLETAKRLNYKITILTNGVWGEKHFQIISRYCDEIQISIDGFSPQTHEVIRGAGSYKIAYGNIIKLLKNNKKVTAAITPSLQTINSVAEEDTTEIQRLLSEFPTTFEVKITQKLLPQDFSSKPSKKENSLYSTAGNQIAKKISSNGLIGLAKDYRSGRRRQNCGYGGLTVTQNGDVFPCNRITEVERLGSLKEKSFLDIITKGERAHSKTKVDMITGCKTCPLRYLCGGGCRIDDTVKIKSILHSSCNGKQFDYILDTLISIHQLESQHYSYEYT